MHKSNQDIENKLSSLLKEDLNFKGQNDISGIHKLHSFPAKFPPQLPNKFILELTKTGDVVLDPMMGSGTVLVESILNGRKAIGFDIDPLAVLISKVKTCPISKNEIVEFGDKILNNATKQLMNNKKELTKLFQNNFDEKTKEFFKYWFTDITTLELMALRNEIQKINNLSIRQFFEVVFSSIIITKSGGVSLALDLAHTRPHKVKNHYLYTQNGLFEKSDLDNYTNSKTIRNALQEFRNKLTKSIKYISEIPKDSEVKAEMGSTLALPISSNSVDLIVTSPPYASNAIDYMRAHKFALTWLNYSIHDLGNLRQEYIGAENTKNYEFSHFPNLTELLLEKLNSVNKRKSLVLRRYYTEMELMLKEMHRVLKNNKCGIIVVGNSNLSGIDTSIQICLKEIAEKVGFIVSDIGIRNIDRNRRMLPVSMILDSKSQIQNRMHKEFIFGIVKSES